MNSSNVLVITIAQHCTVAICTLRLPTPWHWRASQPRLSSPHNHEATRPSIRHSHSSKKENDTDEKGKAKRPRRHAQPDGSSRVSGVPNGAQRTDGAEAVKQRAGVQAKTSSLGLQGLGGAGEAFYAAGHGRC